MYDWSVWFQLTVTLSVTESGTPSWVCAWDRSVTPNSWTDALSKVITDVPLNVP